jgi:hypothetical protein
MMAKLGELEILPMFTGIARAAQKHKGLAVSM